MQTQSSYSTFKAHARPYVQTPNLNTSPSRSTPRYTGLTPAQLREIVMEQLG
jgi:hypothetical protein